MPDSPSDGAQKITGGSTPSRDAGAMYSPVYSRPNVAIGQP